MPTPGPYVCAKNFVTLFVNANEIKNVLPQYILVLKDVEIALPQLSTASIHVEFVVDPDWTGFEFITKKKGAQGPTKGECEKYYTDWYASYYHSPY